METNNIMEIYSIYGDNFIKTINSILEHDTVV